MGADLVPLSDVEEHDLVEHERVIQEKLGSWYDVGVRLADIHSRKLYRATHDTFEAYAADRFGISRSNAYRQIDAAKVVDIVSPIGDIANESQARALVGLDAATAVDVFNRARGNAEGTMTAEALTAARAEIAPIEQKPPRKQNQRPLPDAYRRQVNVIRKGIEYLERLHKDERWKDNRVSIAETQRGWLNKLSNDLVELYDEVDHVQVADVAVARVQPLKPSKIFTDRYVLNLSKLHVFTTEMAKLTASKDWPRNAAVVAGETVGERQSRLEQLNEIKAAVDTITAAIVEAAAQESS